MQTWVFNMIYAESFPELQKDVSYILQENDTTSVMSDQQKAEIVALVVSDQYSWGSGAWFLVHQCGNVRSKIQDGELLGYGEYMKCVGTDPTTDRITYYQRAMQALGLS